MTYFVEIPQALSATHELVAKFRNRTIAHSQSDLLITYAYRLALGGTTPNYGLAGAVAIIIFALVALMSFPGFLRSKQLEEVN